MKQTNLKKCVTVLAIGTCLLAGSVIATAEGQNWQAEPQKNAFQQSLAKATTQEAQEDFSIIDTQFRLSYAKEIHPLLTEKTAATGFSIAPVQVVPEVAAIMMAVQAKATAAKAVPAQIAAFKAPQASPVATAKKAAPKAEAIVQPKVAKTKAAVAQPLVKKTVAKAAPRLTPVKTNIKRKAPSEAAVHTLETSAGSTIKYSRLIPVKASAYTSSAEENGLWGAYDYYGNPLKLGTIAVDPDVIPMGSTVYITGYRFDGLPAEGMIATATDMGSSVKGKRVDIFVPASKVDATKFGLQDVKVYILD